MQKAVINKLLHRVEELLVHDFAIGNLVDGNFFHLKTLVLRLERHVQLKNDREVRAGNKRTFYSSRMNVVVRSPPFTLSKNCVKTFRFSRASWRSSSFHA